MCFLIDFDAECHGLSPSNTVGVTLDTSAISRHHVFLLEPTYANNRQPVASSMQSYHMFALCRSQQCSDTLRQSSSRVSLNNRVIRDKMNLHNQNVSNAAVRDG